MSDAFELIRAAYDVPGLDEHERAVLVRLAVMAKRDDGDRAWPSIAHLVEKTGKSERTVQRAIRRLVEAGHITQRQRRHETAVYTVHPIVTFSDNTEKDRPSCSRPVSVTGVKPTPVAPTPVTDDVNTRPTDTLTTKNNQSSTKTTSSPKRRADAASTFELPDWVPAEAWNGWIEMRRSKGGKDTAYALNLAVARLKELADAGHPPGAVLDQSTLSRWTKLYEIKDPRNEQSRSLGRSAPGRGAHATAVFAAFDRVDLERF